MTTYIRFLLVGFLGVFLCASCSRLQYRLTDTEIQADFAHAKVSTQISYVDIDGLDFKVRIQSVADNSKKYNLVFLHGSPSSLTAWNRYLKDSTLYQNTNLHAIDRPGYGYSNFGKSLVSIDAQSRLINQVIKEKNLDNVIAIGSSYGGPIAARLVIDNKAVKAVIMISPAIDPENEQRVWQSGLTQFWLTRWLVPTGYRVAGDEKTTHAKELASVASDWIKVTVPVMHIHGDADELVPYVNVEYTKRVFSDNEIITIPNVGHELAWRRSELVIPYILQMIDVLEKE